MALLLQMFALSKVTLTVEPVHRCLGQAGHGVVKATVVDVGVGGSDGGRGVAQKLGGLGPKVRLKVSFRKNDNIQKQKAQPCKRANWQIAGAGGWRG
jgi:hypothetical protein